MYSLPLHSILYLLLYWGGEGWVIGGRVGCEGCKGVYGRHTDKSRSPAPDIAVPQQAVCYLSRSNRGL